MDRLDLSVSSFWRVFLGIIGLAAFCALCVYVFTHLKWDFGIEGSIGGSHYARSTSTICG